LNPGRPAYGLVSTLFGLPLTVLTVQQHTVSSSYCCT